MNQACTEDRTGNATAVKVYQGQLSASADSREKIIRYAVIFQWFEGCTLCLHKHTLTCNLSLYPFIEQL